VKLLLDTHTLLWWLSDDSRLGDHARDLIGDPGNDVMVSVASFWEIVVKVRVKKLEADIGAIVDACIRDGFARLDVVPAHLRTLAALPMHHRDPFDHMLIAQAITEDAALLSQDQHIPRYKLRVIACLESR
jgi:PIN domain nuclease of toxin-antitoxin system